MNSVIEKEKKLKLALSKLKNLNLKNPELQNNLKILSSNKNQLEIEKKELEDKYKLLNEDYNNLSKKSFVQSFLSSVRSKMYSRKK